MKKSYHQSGFRLFASPVAATLADAPQVECRKPLAANVGVVSVGLETY